MLAGLGLMIAANWFVIPPALRITGALAVLAVSLLGVFYCDTHEKPMWKEVCLFIAFFLIAGNMAVIQQVFNFNLTWNEGSTIWFALSLPLTILSRKKYLPVLSTLLFAFGVWEYALDIFKYLNYLLISGIFAIVVFMSFLLSGKKAAVVRNVTFGLGLLIMVLGDIHSEDIPGLISTLILVIFLARLPKTEEGQVKFCNDLFIFIAWRVFLLFCGAYHNLMRIGLQLVVFGGALLLIAGTYYYYWDKIQEKFRKLVHHE